MQVDGEAAGAGIRLVGNGDGFTGGFGVAGNPVERKSETQKRRSKEEGDAEKKKAQRRNEGVLRLRG